MKTWFPQIFLANSLKLHWIHPSKITTVITWTIMITVNFEYESIGFISKYIVGFTKEEIDSRWKTWQIRETKRKHSTRMAPGKSWFNVRQFTKHVPYFGWVCAEQFKLGSSTCQETLYSVFSYRSRLLTQYFLIKAQW